MYYAPSVKKMTEEDSINAYFENKKANFKIKMSLAEINNNLFRVDPINTLEVYSIKSITFSDFWGNSIEVSGSKLENTYHLVRMLSMRYMMMACILLHLLRIICLFCHKN